MRESGYMYIQCIKFDIVGFVLNDFFVGLVVYILEKFFIWINMEF